MSAVADHIQSDLLPTTSTPLGISFLEEMIKHSTLVQEYRMQVARMRSALHSKEAIIQELEKEVGSAKKIKVPEITMKLACIVNNPTEDNRILLSILTSLLENNGARTKRWNDTTKNLFAKLLDYGGPALAKICI